MDGTLAIILLVACLALLAAEVFIPSGGLILIAALVCLAGSIWLGWRAWWNSPPWFWIFIGSIVVLVPSAIGGVLYWFPRTTMGKRMLLDGPTLEEVTGYTAETSRLQALIGKRGKSITLMNPGGLVLVEGERHHSESQGLLIEPNEPIEVIGVSGTRIVVRQVQESAETTSPSSFNEPAAGQTPVAAAETTEESRTDDRALDFEMPAS